MQDMQISFMLTKLTVLYALLFISYEKGTGFAT